MKAMKPAASCSSVTLTSGLVRALRRRRRRSGMGDINMVSNFSLSSMRLTYQK